MSILQAIVKYFAYSEEDLAKYQEEVREAEARVKELNDEMTSKFCPIINGTCRRTCINFKEGFVVEETGKPGGWVCAHKPKCRLWKRS